MTEAKIICYLVTQVAWYDIWSQYQNEKDEAMMGGISYLKLEIFIPETHLATLQSALRSVDAGHIGNYDSCISYSPVMGTWRPMAGTTPYIGTEGQISCEPELKVEVTIRAERYKETMEAIKHVHPYEEPVINAIPLRGTSFSD